MLGAEVEVECSQGLARQVFTHRQQQVGMGQLEEEAAHPMPLPLLIVVRVVRLVLRVGWVLARRFGLPVVAVGLGQMVAQQEMDLV